MLSQISEQSIPQEMKTSNQWVLWRLEGKTDSYKGTKIPYSTKNPYQKASTTNPNTWGTFGEAIPLAHLHNMNGVGYIFKESDGLVGIDIDECIENNIPNNTAKEILELFSGKTYIETSQSGRGYHIILKGTPKTKSFKDVELYTSGRYFAITGNLVGGCNSINRLQNELNIFCDRYGKEIPIPQINWDRQKTTDKSSNIVDKLGMSVESIGFPGNAKRMSNGEIRGAHPFHGSTTGMNYAINTNKNVWICRRDGHNSGGGPLELFAIKEGIINCEDARKGCLDGKWKEVFQSLKLAGYNLVDTGIEKQKPPNKEKGHETTFSLTDTHNTDFGNVDRFLHTESGYILYSKLQDSWYIWNENGYWERDAINKIQEKVKQTFRNIYQEAAAYESPEKRSGIAKWAMVCEKPEHVSACLKLSQSHKDIAVLPSQFDSDKYLFNLTNGTYDLETHQYLQHDRINFITRKGTFPYDPKADCPEFKKFLIRIFKSREDKDQIIQYIQKAIGYSLTGETSQQVIFLLHGEGSNGKSTLIETLRILMGDYGTAVASKSLTTTKNDSVRNDIARLPGMRFVAAPEAPKGTTLDEELIKSLTGGDQITARFLFQEEFLFYPMLKLWWYFNHPPNVRDMTHSLWRRLKLIPFNEIIPTDERIPMELILDKHRKEISGIFNWAIDGLKLYQKEGLKDIDAVTTAVKEMKDEQDVLMGFVLDACFVPEKQNIIKADIVCKASDLYEGYKKWCDYNHEKPKSQMWLGKELKERGYKKERKTNGYIYHGIRLKTQEESFRDCKGSG